MPVALQLVVVGAPKGQELAGTLLTDAPTFGIPVVPPTSINSKVKALDVRI